MRNIILKTATTFTVILLLTINANAQGNFSGNWKRNDDKTIVEGLSINSLPISLEIAQDTKSVNIKRTSKNGQGEASSYTDLLKFDGSTADVTTPSKLKRTSSATWSADKKELTQYYTAKDDQGNIKQTGKQTFSLIDSGKTLKVVAELHFEDKTFNAEEIFDKQ
ncbi:MAG: hypothetical protein JWQ66_361 [Mucilaginibacter sp.]|nr:hypothetical protein [Mucilaginibacter sp.]